MNMNKGCLNSIKTTKTMQGRLCDVFETKKTFRKSFKYK